jgi:hypothetical protein
MAGDDGDHDPKRQRVEGEATASPATRSVQADPVMASLVRQLARVSKDARDAREQARLAIVENGRLAVENGRLAVENGKLEVQNEFLFENADMADKRELRLIAERDQVAEDARKANETIRKAFAMTSKMVDMAHANMMNTKSICGIKGSCVNAITNGEATDPKRFVCVYFVTSKDGSGAVQANYVESDEYSKLEKAMETYADFKRTGVLGAETVEMVKREICDRGNSLLTKRKREQVA